MKKIIFLLTAVLTFMAAAARDNYSHDVNILPDAAREFIDNGFESEVSHIKIGKQFGYIRTYDVIMTDGSEISFDKHGVWNDVVVGHDGEMPSVTMLPPIAKFVKENHGEANVTGIRKVADGYELDLSDGKDAQFTSKGKFIGYSD